MTYHGIVYWQLYAKLTLHIKYVSKTIKVLCQLFKASALWADALYKSKCPSVRLCVLGMGKGVKRTLELVNYRLESRPLTDPRPRSLGLELDLTQNRT